MKQVIDIDTCIDRVSEDTLITMLGLTAVPNVQARDQFFADLDFGGVVHIVGDWLGSIAFRCSSELGSIFTRRIFQLDGENILPEQKDEVARELANMLGGNLKTVLGAKCILSGPKTLRQVHLIGREIPEARLIAERSYLCCNEPLLISVYESLLDIPSC